MKSTFILPDLDALSRNQQSSEKIVIISIFGKSPYNSKGLKVFSVGRMFAKTCSNNKECSVTGYYDEDNQIIYLHMNSMLDTNLFVNCYESVVERTKTAKNTDDYLTVHDEIKSSFVQSMLLLFYISHIVVISLPGRTFDLNYVQYFKAAHHIRQKLTFSEILKDVEGISTEWASNGRFCIPRLIFYFERAPCILPCNKKLEHNMEDRIYHVLKKTRIISSTSYSLFAIPLNEEFVFISDEGGADDLGEAVRGLIQGCTPKGFVTVEAPFSSEPSSKNFLQFLQVHVQQAREKGFDDSVRHNHMHPIYFELPQLQHWIAATKLLYDAIVTPKLINSLCTDTLFSEQRCLKVLPLAVARYQEGLPSHYTRATHEARLATALALFAAQARGPVFHKYSSQLEADCLAHWEAGRQLCEVASLTGLPCTLPRHSNEKEHSSGVRFIAACDCGRKQGSRDDPYSAKQANFTFYQQLAKECICSNLDRITFPVFEPSIKEYKAATLADSEEPLSVLSDRSGELTPDAEHKLSRQPSTTEYLPGMLTLSAPLGLLPQFPSWSLVCLGASSLYSHNMGLSESVYPGFLPGTNYLLPWDVTVNYKSKIGLPPGSKHALRGRRPRSTSNMPQYSVKIFIGVEYECPRGHRFMLAGPDRVLRSSPNSMVKDTGHKIAESDMPLYFPCPCRSAKPFTAQLMRLHIVTPKAPVSCTLNPKVQPDAGAPIFVSTLSGPTALTQSAYWVMRLPYIYISDKGNYPENRNAKLLQGVFGVGDVDFNLLQ